MEDESFVDAKIFKQSNTFFFNFHLYIDFKIYPLKLADLKPCASLIHWSKTGQKKLLSFSTFENNTEEEKQPFDDSRTF